MPRPSPAASPARSRASTSRTTSRPRKPATWTPSSTSAWRRRSRRSAMPACRPTTSSTPRKRERIGCLVGSGIGGLPLIEDTKAELEKRGPRRITPFFVPASIINMISGHVSIMYGFKGPNLAIVTACTTGLHSIGMAGRMIEYGDADVMIAGGAEATVSPLGIGGFAAARALSTRNDDPATASRPWDKDRDGFVLGEGAGVLVLEEYEHAQAARRQDLRRADRLRHGRRRVPHDGAQRRRAEALDAGRAALGGAQRRPGAVPQRARHVDAARRRQRDQRDQARLRRPRQASSSSTRPSR